jgi:hypothetical protein
VTDLGGDPACWLDRVCDACGAVLDDGAGHDCPAADPDDTAAGDDDRRAPICPHCGVTALPADAAHVLDTGFACENPDCDAFGERL